LVRAQVVLARDCDSSYLVQYTNQSRPLEIRAGDLPSAMAKPGVRFVEKNACFSASLTPNDPLLGKQWYLNKIYAKEAWNIRHDASNIVVAVLDSGVDMGHPDLVNNVWVNRGEISGNGLDDDQNGFIDDINGWNFVDNNNNPRPQFTVGYTDDVLHGTIVAGIIGAEGNNSLGVAGIAWKVQLMPLKVLDDKGVGSAADVQRAIDYAIAKHVDVINLSFVGSEYSQALYEAIRRAHDAGIVVVAAAGNNSVRTTEYSLDKKPLYPICMDGAPGENLVIGVAATDAIDQRASFSGFGKNCIDISAPGISVFSTTVHRPDQSLSGEPLDKYYDGFWSGTSVAAPMVTGAVVLIKAVNPELNRQEVLDVLLHNTVAIDQFNPGLAGQLGTGRLNIEAALIDAKTRQSQSESNLLVAQAIGGSMIRTFTSNGQLLGQFLAFDKNFKGGIKLAVGDVDGDREQEIVVVPASAGGPQVKIFDGHGHLKNSFWAFEKNYRGGLNLQVADLDHGNLEQIIVGPAGARSPEIKIFDYLGHRLGSFLAYEKNFKGGVNLATFDINNDEELEIATAPANNHSPLVKFFSASGQLISSFMPIDRKNNLGMSLAIGDFSGRAFDREKSLLVLPNKSNNLLIFSRQLSLKYKITLDNFQPLANSQLAVADFNRDGVSEIALAATTRQGSSLRIYNIQGRIVSSFKPYPISSPGYNLAFSKK
jgi:subtilisin family serine protease